MQQQQQQQQQGAPARGPQFFPPTPGPSHLQQLQQQHLQMHGILPGANGRPPMASMYAQHPNYPAPPMSRPFAPPPPLPTSQQYPLGYPPPATSYQQLQQQRPVDYGRVLPLAGPPQGQVDLMALLNGGGGGMRGPPQHPQQHPQHQQQQQQQQQHQHQQNGGRMSNGQGDFY